MVSSFSFSSLFYNRMEIKAIYSAPLKCIIVQALTEKKKKMMLGM